jgi:hypothetical protein
MASNRAVATAIAALHEAYPTRAITGSTRDVFAIALANVTDEQLAHGTRTLLQESGRTWFPAPGEIIAASLPPDPAVDVSDIVRRIDRLGHYVPTRGHIPPRVDTVRNTMGDAIADAYADAVPDRVFSDDEKTRQIALHQFGKALVDARRRYAIAGILAKADDVARIAAPAAEIVGRVNDVARALSAPNRPPHLPTRR